MRTSRSLLIFALTVQLLTACTMKKAQGAPVAQLNPSLSTTVSAVVEAETSVQLEDGAQVIVPANALSGPAEVTLERNPQKSTSLPALPAGVTQLSDFYSINIEGAELRTAVELILPFNMAAIPDDQADGILMALFPSGDGWEYVPVQTNGSYAILVTDRTGDPLIAWNFRDIRTPEEKQQYLERLKARAICSPIIPLQMIPLENKEGVTIIGRLQPAKFNYLGFIPRAPAAGVTVDLYVNKVKPYTLSDAIPVVADADGNFSITLKLTDPDSDLVAGKINWVRAAANCDAWPGEISVLSEGHTTASLIVETTPSAPTPPPAILAPTDNRVLVTIPDVVGLTKEEAIARLLDAGMMVALGDGVSGYDVGVVFRQDPAAGSVVDPYQVAALIYVTSETSGPASLLQRFGHAYYTCTSYVGHSYTWDAPYVVEGCGSMVYKIINDSGELKRTLVSRDGGEQTHTLANLNEGLPTRPIGAWVSMGSHLWWLPDTSQTYSYPAWTSETAYSNYKRVDSQSDLVYVPGATFVITVAGRQFDAVTYTAEYTGEFRDTWTSGVYEHQIFYYRVVDTYDRVSGILLRSESYVTWGPCSTDNQSSPICMSGAMTGRTSSVILELSEIDLP